MCQSVAEGGRRCATHTRPRYEAATFGDQEWDDAAAEYAATREGERALNNFRSNARKDGDVEREVAADTAIARGKQLRDAARTTRELVRPATCPRCRGAGFVSSRVVHNNAPGGCFKCSGAGVVETDRATLREAKRLPELHRDACEWATQTGVANGVSRPKAFNLTLGLNHLQENEPERHLAFLNSFENRHPGLYEALVRYTAERGYIHYGARELTPDEAVATFMGNTPTVEQ